MKKIIVVLIVWLPFLLICSIVIRRNFYLLHTAPIKQKNIFPYYSKEKYVSVYTDLDQESADYYAHFSEHFYEFVSANIFDISKHEPVTIYMVKDENLYKKYAGGDTMGLYRHSSREIFVDIDMNIGTLTHELIHHELSSFSTSTLNSTDYDNEEGFCRLFEKVFGYVDGQNLILNIGYVNPRRFENVYFGTGGELTKNEMTLIGDDYSDLAHIYMVYLYRQGKLSEFIKMLENANNKNAIVLAHDLLGKEGVRGFQGWFQKIPSSEINFQPTLMSFVGKNKEDWESWLYLHHLIYNVTGTVGLIKQSAN